ncbi:Sortase (surface protein transpeptidase) [Mycobacteroides abscessus subsp. abscessus]|nr:Sortase (surface protein transpeptidase) [Mycobacteroides abscessus subsp. abscessus]
MMRARKEKSGKKKKGTILLIISILFISFGVFFSGTNSYKFLKGYMLYKLGQIEFAERNSDSTTEKVQASTVQKDSLYSKKPEIGENIGDLVIPKIEATLPIIHGTAEEELEKGVGHFAGSVLPGELDNSVLSGHRDTVFRRLGEVGKGDLLIVTTSAGEFTYRVNRVRIVDADDRTVIVPKPKATLTVSTCYPFDYIGDAPQRYILVASLVKKNETESEKQ